MLRISVERGANTRQVLTKKGPVDCPFCEHGQVSPVSGGACEECSARVTLVAKVYDGRGEEPMGDKSRGNWNPNFGVSKIQGRGDVDPKFHSLLEALLAAVKAKYIPAVLVDGFVRALKESKQTGLLEALEAVEAYEARLKSGELGNLSATKAVVELRSLINNMALGAVGHSFF